MSEKRIIEINGVKLEVDLSTARRVDEFRVGDTVKVLRNQGSGFTVEPGVIVEFVNFKSLPTIQIAVFKTSMWDGNRIEFLDYNAESKGLEIVACGEHELRLEKNSIVDKMNAAIEEYQHKADDLRAKRDWFLKYFGKYFDKKPEDEGVGF